MRVGRAMSMSLSPGGEVLFGDMGPLELVPEEVRTQWGLHMPTLTSSGTSSGWRRTSKEALIRKCLLLLTRNETAI